MVHLVIIATMKEGNEDKPALRVAHLGVLRVRKDII